MESYAPSHADQKALYLQPVEGSIDDTTVEDGTIESPTIRPAMSAHPMYHIPPQTAAPLSPGRRNAHSPTTAAARTRLRQQQLAARLRWFEFVLDGESHSSGRYCRLATL
eukprot:m51a1_g9600 hypothetical protein (110) ;mRNA; r:1046119-1046538